MAYYAEHAQQLKRELAAELPVDELRRLHEKRPLLHAAVAFGNVAALLIAAVAIVHFDRWYAWLPFAVVASVTGRKVALQRLQSWLRRIGMR